MNTGESRPFTKNKLFFIRVFVIMIKNVLRKEDYYGHFRHLTDDCSGRFNNTLLIAKRKSDGLGSAFGGSEGLNLFANVKERGSEKVMSNVTLVTGIVFFALVIIIRIVK